MKKLLTKFMCFAPLAAVLLLDSALPLDYFNHRVWESMVVMRPNAVLKGYFYPRTRLVKNEAASDMDYYRGMNVRKTNEWVTDHNGYRKAEPYRFPITVAVIGDSNVAGSGLTQKDLFTEVLEEKIGTGVYPLAPGGIESVFFTPFFRAHPPRTVIVSFIERNLPLSAPYQPSPRQGLFAILPLLRDLSVAGANAAVGPPLISDWAVFIDRFFYKKTLAQFVKARLFIKKPPLLSSEEQQDLPALLFFQGDYANRDIPDEVLEATAAVYKSYHDACVKAGMRFVFMPIPNKENIYYDLLPAKKKPDFIPRLLARLRALGVETVDLQQAYHDFRKENPGMLLYDPEEAHWNRVGVRVAADAAARLLTAPPQNDRIPANSTEMRS